MPHYRISQVLSLANSSTQPDQLETEESFEEPAILMDLFNKTEIPFEHYHSMAVAKSYRVPPWRLEHLCGEHPFEIATDLARIFLLLLDSGTLRDMHESHIVIGQGQNRSTVRVFDWSSAVYDETSDRYHPNFAHTLDLNGKFKELRFECDGLLTVLYQLLDIYNHLGSGHKRLITLIWLVNTIRKAASEYQLHNGERAIVHQALEDLREWLNRQ